jgi:hypothetical protein
MWREVEHTVLDREYRRFDFIYRNYEIAIPWLLRTFGDQVRDMIYDPDLATKTEKQNLMDRRAAGLGHCLKWIIGEPEHTLLPPDNGPEVITREALDLLDWGASYHELYLDHVALSKGEKVARVDRESKTIEIRFSEPFDPFFFFTQKADDIDYATSHYAAMPTEELNAEFQHWSATAPLRLRSVRPGERAHEAAARWADEIIWPELGADTSLDGFSLGDYRRVFAGLEDVEDQMQGAIHMRTSGLVEFQHERMAEWLAEIGGVGVAAAREIVDELTLDTTRLLPTIAYQPFVKSKANRMYLLPRLIPYFDAARALSQILNTGGRQRVFAGLGERITDAQLQRITEAFVNLGLDVVADRPLRYEGREIRPDLLLYDRANDYLLVADYKNMINPVGPAQSISNIKNIRKYVAKVREYVRVVTSDFSVLRARIPALSETPTVSGLLLFRDPTPLPLEPEPPVAMANWFSLRKFLSGGGYGDLPGLVAWVANRPDLAIRPGSYRLENFQAKVGDWRYVSEMIVRDLA